VKTARRSSAFTLIELLVVISILGILAALTVPALKNLGKSNIQTSASRQLLDDVGRARQLAISGHTTVYMVFVPTNFWNATFLNGLNSITPSSAQSVALQAATNLIADQLTGYTFMSYGKLGDQPGQHQWHYLSPSWQVLPQGNIIAAQKFTNTLFDIPMWESSYSRPSITNFATAPVPFPTENAPLVYMPFIAFNYLGQLTFDGVNLSTRDEYIPLAQGSVSYALDPATKIPVIPATAPVNPVSETPPGNSTNISYNVVHIDALTGRATLEYQKVQ
jgi:prepilin-type N-terminal cleavage/methylation domain-containing protein